MLSLTNTLTLSPPPHPSCFTKSSSPLVLLTLRPTHTFATPKKQKRRLKNRVCRAELSRDAPFAVAIGACIISSLVLPHPSAPNDNDNDNDDEESKSMIDTWDARSAVMGIISLIPYFNWMSWVFAWMDTGRRRYLAYALVYLASYTRSNLSLSAEESWLPIASILFCIFHIQLEASINNGDVQGFQLFAQGAKDLKEEDTRISNEEGSKEQKNLLSEQEQSHNELGDHFGRPRKPSVVDSLNSTENEDEDERRH